MTKEEIEKEAEEKFKVNNKDKDREHYYDRMWFKTGYLAGAEPREKRIEELEEENERLKGDLELWESGGCRVTNLFECGVVKDLKEQLTKAKELLELFVQWNYGCCKEPDYKNLVKQAEHFLLEVDIDNAIQKANESLDLDKIADEVEQDLNESCPDVLCKDCNKEDCIARKLGLIC